MEFDFQKYISRKFVYGFFFVIVLFILGIIFYWTVFYQVLELKNSEISVKNSGATIKFDVFNKSNHPIRNVLVTVFFDKNVSRYGVFDVNAHDSYSFEKQFPISDNLKYIVEVSAPFNPSLKQPFEITGENINPIELTVQIPLNLKLNVSEVAVLTACNISNISLQNIVVEQTFDSTYFSGDFYPYNFSLAQGECKPLYSTFTPIKSGKTSIEFSVIVGGVPRKASQEVTIE